MPYTTDTASVDANLSGLTPGTVYEYRVQLVDGGSTVQGANGSFRTKYVPATSVTNTTGIGETTATLNGRVDDNSLPGVKYHFEYGTTTDYGTSTPEADAAINQTSVAVSAPVTGLAAGTKYHVRTVVRYDGRTFVSGDEVFTTKAAAVISQPTLKATLGSLGKVKLKKTRKYGVGVTCSLDCSLTATLSTTRKVAKRLKLKRVLAKASGSGKAGAASKLTFKLTRKLRAKLRAKKVRSLKLTVTARSGTAAPVTMTGTVKLKR